MTCPLGESFVQDAACLANSLKRRGKSQLVLDPPLGQTIPFPADTVPRPDADTPRVAIESVSMPLASRHSVALTSRGLYKSW
jgi:hypothetical protein